MIANAIQATAAVCIVLLTGWTLKVLREYAHDTKRIANDSASQIERAQMPFLAVSSIDHGPGRIAGFVIENQGFGPAMNVRYMCSAQNRERIRRTAIPCVAAGRNHPAHNDISATFHVGEPIEIEYASLSGQGYRTVIRLVNNEMQTEFTRQ